MGGRAYKKYSIPSAPTAARIFDFITTRGLHPAANKIFDFITPRVRARAKSSARAKFPPTAGARSAPD